MTFKSRVNHYRRNIMYSITKSVGSSYVEPEFGSLNPETIKKVLIIRPNHRLGNQLLLTPLVQEVINIFPNCEIDLFVKGGVAHPVLKIIEKLLILSNFQKNLGVISLNILEAGFLLKRNHMI